MHLKNTRSLCPVCTRVLDAEIYDKDGEVRIKRTCPEHGEFDELYWSDTELYKRFDKYESIGTGIDNPQSETSPEGCPADCGLCPNHKSGTLLANIDLTNRCNLNCDFCFANARACGYVYEPTFEQIVYMLEVLRAEKPVPAPAVQFSGGEPSLRSDLLEIIKKAKEVGFDQVQMATNGITIAKDPEEAARLKEAGLSTVYLHFDGVTKETNPKINLDRKVVQHCAKAGLGIVLVPTIINGRNDHEVGDIIRFAAENIDVVRGINYQPVSFTGAANPENVQKERITIPDLLDRIEAQTGGAIKKDHFYPVPCVVPISDFAESYTGNPQIRFTTHQHCGAATYGFVKDDGGLIAVNDMIDVDAFFATIGEMSKKLDDAGIIRRYFTILSGFRQINSALKQEDHTGRKKFWKLLKEALTKQDFEALKNFHWNALFIGTMHFMDSFNYDIDRVQRCCIHYTSPDGRLIPFCTYNSGPVYREKVWKEFSVDGKDDTKIEEFE